VETRTTFHKSLREVEEAVLTMGNMVVKAIDRAIEGLKKRDLTLAHQIIADDTQINKQRFSIENDCIGLIATQQPVAVTYASLWLSSTSSRSWNESATMRKGLPRLLL
jgi:phosphate transport system protein